MPFGTETIPLAIQVEGQSLGSVSDPTKFEIITKSSRVFNQISKIVSDIYLVLLNPVTVLLIIS